MAEPAAKKQRLEDVRFATTVSKLQSNAAALAEMLKIGCCCRCVLTLFDVHDMEAYTAEADIAAQLSVQFTEETCVACLGLFQRECVVSSEAPSSSSPSALPSSSSVDTSSSLATPAAAEALETPAASELSASETPATEVLAPEAIPSSSTFTAHPSIVDVIVARIAAEDYEIADFSLSLHFPSSLLIRREAVRRYMRHACPGFTPSGGQALLKEAIKSVVGTELALRLPNAPQAVDGDFSIILDWKVDETPIDAAFIKELCPDTHSKGKKGMTQPMSHVTVQKALERSSDEDFRRHGLFPPSAVRAAHLDLQLSMRPFLVSGNYVKLSRNLSQTPWEIDGKRKGETSVEEEAVRAVVPRFRPETLKFHSSGREDVDVRMLGRGRPFVLELYNCRRHPSGPGFYADMEREMNAGSSIVQVNSMAPCSKESFEKMKNQVADKKKTYRCIVQVSRPLVPADLAPVDALVDVEVLQQTPVRVLHRRSQLTRQKWIHSAKTTFINPHFFLLDLTASSGTYIKEFVHSDRGRTNPSLGEMLACDADILQLDVLEVFF